MFQLPVPVLDANAGSGASAFGKLPDGTVDTLLMEENRTSWSKFLRLTSWPASSPEAT